MTTDAIDSLEDLFKATGHKYKSRKRVGNRWTYDYGLGYGKGKPKKAEAGAPQQLDLFGNVMAPAPKAKPKAKPPAKAAPSPGRGWAKNDDGSYSIDYPGVGMAKLAKEGNAWFVTAADGHRVRMPKKGGSLDHAEGALQEIARAKGDATHREKAKKEKRAADGKIVAARAKEHIRKEKERSAKAAVEEKAKEKRIHERYLAHVKAKKEAKASIREAVLADTELSMQQTADTVYVSRSNGRGQIEEVAHGPWVEVAKKLGDYTKEKGSGVSAAQNIESIQKDIDSLAASGSRFPMERVSAIGARFREAISKFKSSGDVDAAVSFTNEPLTKLAATVVRLKASSKHTEQMLGRLLDDEIPSAEKVTSDLQSHDWGEAPKAAPKATPKKEESDAEYFQRYEAEAKEAKRQKREAGRPEREEKQSYKLADATYSVENLNYYAVDSDQLDRDIAEMNRVHTPKGANAQEVQEDRLGGSLLRLSKLAREVKESRRSKADRERAQGAIGRATAAVQKKLAKIRTAIRKREAKKSMSYADPIDALEALYKSGDDDEAYMLGYKDAQSGKPAKPASAAPQVDQEEEDGDADGVIENAPDEQAQAQEGQEEQDPGTDLDGDGDADLPGQDVDGDGDLDPQTQDPNQDPEQAQAQGSEEAGDLPADDGDNHGVGDLDEDGQENSLIQEITNLEKLYYAAKGLHGSGHHKADKALDLYHRAVRKMVRAQMGGGEPAPEQEGPPGGKSPFGGDGQEEGGDDQEEDKGKPNPFEKKGGEDKGGKPNPFEKKGAVGGEEDDSEEEDKKKPFGKSMDPLDSLVLEHGEPRDITPVLERILKARKASRKASRKVPGSPYEYLMGFVRSEVDGAREGIAAQGGKVDIGGLSQMVIAKMVDRFTVDGKLQEAAKKYHLTAGSISPVIEQLLGISTPDDTSITSDAQSHSAMGCESMAYSRTASDLKATDNALGAAPRNIPIVNRGPKQVHLVDDREDPSVAFAKSRRGALQGFKKSMNGGGQEPLLRVNTGGTCPFHAAGGEAPYKSRHLTKGYLHCTCPR